jgi:hypothetical protein
MVMEEHVFAQQSMVKKEKKGQQGDRAALG